MPASSTPNGTVAPGFEPVAEAFASVAAAERTSTDPGYAAQLVAYLRGRRVVDLWTGPDFDGDSLTGVFSSTKGAAHLVVALLVQDGVLDLDRRVSHYWPGFAAEGKGELTLRELLAHRAGVVGSDLGFSAEELADEPLVAERLAAQRPYWRPGTAFGYHALVIGALTGEVVRRVTGQSIHELFERRVRAPYRLDFYLGLPQALEPRFASTLPMRPTPEQQAELEAFAVGAHSLTGIAFNHHHPDAPELAELPNHPVVRAAGPTSVGGVASARGMAGMYAAAIGALDGRPPLLEPATIASVGQIQSVGLDLVARQQRAFGLGFEASAQRYPQLGQGAFGHAGAAGSEAFADPRAGLAYAYNRRRYAFPGGPAAENVDLVRAVHAAATAAGAS